MIFCSQTNTCVTQWAAVSDVVHISYVSCPCGSVLTVSLCMKLFTVCFHTHSTFLPHILDYIYVNVNMHTLRMHARTQCSHTLLTLITRSISHFVSLFSSSCVFFLPTFLCFDVQPRAQPTCST